MVTEAESPPMPDYTSIRVTEELADELHDRKSRGESYEDVIWNIIESEDVDIEELRMLVEEWREKHGENGSPEWEMCADGLEEAIDDE